MTTNDDTKIDKSNKSIILTPYMVIDDSDTSKMYDNTTNDDAKLTKSNKNDKISPYIVSKNIDNVNLLHNEKNNNISEFLADNNYCELCDIKIKYPSELERHIKTKHHIKNIENYYNKQSNKDKIQYNCNNCVYSTYKKTDWNRHINSIKHIRNTSDNEEDRKYICKECNKTYSNRNGLWRHKQKCLEKTQIILTSYNDTNILKISNKTEVLKINNINETQNLIMTKDDLKDLIIEVVKNNNELFKQNQDFQEKMFEMLKNSNSVTNNMNNCNNQNTFNLQFFLNETCKDAMNMSDFINSFNLQMDDLERLADDGYVKTMSNLIVNKVRELDTDKRPIHCSDEKRETIYIKEDNVWVKDDEHKTHLRKAVNKIGCRNIGILQDWQQAHPNCIKANSPYNDTYLKMMKEVMGGKNTTSNENKVIKNIIKEVVIDKQQYLQ